MTVVVGTTLRPDSAPLAEVAALVAERLGAPLRLVHVCEDPRAPLVLGTDQEDLIGDVRGELARQAEELAHGTGARVHPHLATGSVVTTLAALAELELATVLFVGSSSRPMARIAERVSRRSTIPVVVLRQPERFTAWLRGETPLRVLVGIDLGRAAQAARQFAARLAELGPLDLEVLHVASPAETHARMGIATEANDTLSPEAEAALLRELAVAAPASEPASALRVVPGRGGADAHLTSRADDGAFDLVIVGQRRRSAAEHLWRSSVAQGVLKGAPANVATVPLPLGVPDTAVRRPATIVVGVAFDEIDRRALAHAVAHADPDATIHLVHAVAGIGTASEVRQASEHARYRLAKLVRDHLRDDITGAALEVHVVEGAPATQLLAAATRFGADLIVVGVRERALLSRALLGSVAWALVDEARVPVLLVPERRP